MRATPDMTDFSQWLEAPQHPRLAEGVRLLQRLISTPSFSREESATADIWYDWLRGQGVTEVERRHNNVFAIAPGFRPDRPTLLLNSHHDTVRPVASYTRDPFSPDIKEGRLYGLGSNDAGASGVALASTYLDLREETDPLPYNLILGITAAEEVMGELGMRDFLPMLRERGCYPDLAIVGEPTGMNPAIAERGLVVLDGETRGVSGHAARGEGVNALYRALDDIARLREFQFPEVSRVLGPVRISVTMINCGTQHNVVPDLCRYVVDVRTTDAYSNEETVEILRKAVRYSTLTPRSTRIQPSVIREDHPLVLRAVAAGGVPFISPTTSDMALMHGITSMKIGPGDSARSHTADEFILLSELNDALYRLKVISDK